MTTRGEISYDNGRPKRRARRANKGESGDISYIYYERGIMPRRMSYRALPSAFRLMKYWPTYLETADSRQRRLSFWGTRKKKVVWGPTSMCYFAA